MFFKRCACLLLLTAALLSGSCASSRRTNAAVGYVPQRATPARASASPTLAAVKASTDKADEQAAKAADAVDRALRGGLDVKNSGRAAMAEAEQLSRKSAAYAEALSELLSKLKAQTVFVEQLIDNITSAKEALTSERLLRQQAEQDLTVAQMQVAGKEDEASRLREQLAQEQEVASDLRQVAETNATLANDNADKAAATRGASSLKSKLITGLALLATVEFLLLLGLARFKFLP